MLNRITKVMIVIVMVTASIAFTAGPAQAGGGGSYPSTCLYAEWYPGEENCPGPRPKAKPKFVTVGSGDTLWRIAVRTYGPGEQAGHQWKAIARMNGIKGTKIHAGQRLRVR